MHHITSQELSAMLNAGEKAMFIDVRTPAEHAEVHVAGTRLIPLHQIGSGAFDEIPKGEKVFILCGSGKRAGQAGCQLEKMGFENCVVVEGGITAWMAAGLPVVRGGKSVLSLERQVRIAAGTIVLAGVVLAQVVAPAFIWLSGFIGAGLIFAGITDWCGMGLLLARMPWNQRTGA